MRAKLTLGIIARFPSPAAFRIFSPELKSVSRETFAGKLHRIRRFPRVDIAIVVAGLTGRNSCICRLRLFSAMRHDIDRHLIGDRKTAPIIAFYRHSVRGEEVLSHHHRGSSNLLAWTMPSFGSIGGGLEWVFAGRWHSSAPADSSPGSRRRHSIRTQAQTRKRTRGAQIARCSFSPLH